MPKVVNEQEDAKQKLLAALYYYAGITMGIDPKHLEGFNIKPDYPRVTIEQGLNAQTISFDIELERENRSAMGVQ